MTAMWYVVSFLLGMAFLGALEALAVWLIILKDK